MKQVTFISKVKIFEFSHQKSHLQLSKSIDLNAIHNNGRTTFFFLVNMDPKMLLNHLKNETFLYILSRSIDLNAKLNDGRTTFIFACEYGHKNVVK